MKNLAKRIAELSPEKRQLLERLLRKEGVNVAQTLILPRGNGQASFPLSSGQQRLWFLDQWQPGGSLYNIAAAVRLSGPLDEAALEAALNGVVKRHETLRTTFAVEDGRPVQVIAAALTLPLQKVDLTHLPEADREAEAARLAAEEARRPFDLARGPVLRATLFRLAGAEHVVLLVMHHIVSDGWSMRVLIRELAALYDGCAGGQPAALPDLPIQYADFAHWQQQWLQGKALESQLAYWKEQLAGPLPVLELPTDRPRPAVQSFRGARQSFTLPKPLCEGLRELSRREGATLYMTLLAAFQVLLHRYTGQEDLLVGSPIANRSRAETEGLIGFFVNTLVLRTDLSGDPSFRELLGRVRQVALAAYAHQDLPFEKLVEALQPERNLSLTPLFQVVFGLDHDPVQALKHSSLTVSAWQIDTGTAKFDLSLAMLERPDELAGFIEYNTDLFEAATISRMLGHFQTVLEGVVADAEQRLSCLPLLTTFERQQLLRDWNDTDTVYPREQGIHRLFEVQVERTPDAVAVVHEGNHITYRELNRRANQLAHHLRGLGVGPEVLVGICLERSVDLVVGLLGILKAGGAYLPLDAAYPAERLAFMLQDAQVPVLLTQQRLVASPPDHGARVVRLDADWDVIARHSATNLAGGAGGDNLAYVIYTSGSTGKPKGTCIPHRAVNRLVFNTDYVQLDSTDRVAQASNASFDAATFEIWGALLFGARLVVITKDVALSPQDFAAQLRQEGITVLFLTTALFNQLARETPGAFRSLRTLLFGGEAVDPRWVREVLQNGPPERLLHVYGPTECTTFSSWFLVREVPDGAATVPIGRPISNTRIYVLDRQRRPVPVGVPGELYVGGEGLARGYLNRPELTAEKFVPDPFRGEPGARLYRTGDLVRFLPDGTIEFLGRLDHQVKLRGFRVELGEIEAVLGQHPAVHETFVMAREDSPGEKRLVAYVIAKDQPAPAANELRSYLLGKLPEYMVPASFVYLDSWPLAPNGKVDRRALPAPERTRPDMGRSFVAPRTPVEEVLAGIWGQVLNLDGIGVHDNFFELGGHSLLATQLLSRVRTAFQVELPLRRLFETPTIAALAEHIETARQTEPRPAAPPLRPLARDGVLPLSFAQQRLWFLDQLEPGNPFYNVPAAVRLTGPLQVDAWRQSLEAIVRRHEALRTTFATVDGQPVQVIAPAGSVPLTVVDLREPPEAEREARTRKLAREEALRPFDLARGPLVRAGLLRLADEEHVALLTLHHIVSDGWSVGVLLREMAALYQAFVEGKPASLPDLAIQYADFAHWQRHWLRGDVLEAQLAYWKEKLGGRLPVLELPTDRPRPAVQTYRGATETLALPGPLTEAVKALSQREGATLYMTLLAAFQALLCRYSGQEDVLVGSPIANRGRAETEGLIGFFVNTLVLRTDLSGDPSFRALLHRVRETALGAYAHQDLPFEKLVEALQPGRDLSRSPLFQVMFILQNAPMPALELAGLKLSPVAVDHGTAKYDLTLSLVDTAGGLAAELEYNTDLFDAARMRRMLGHFQTLLEGVVADPEQRLSRLPLLTAGERQQLLETWNHTEAAFPCERCIHQLFEAQVERTPDAVAVACEGTQVTYRELNRRANQLAHHLRELGVGPEVLVGICLERSVDLVVGLLGILKAGGAYLPLDAAYPTERLAFMLQDAQVPVLLSQQRLKAGLPEHGARVVRLDEDWEAIARHSEANPAGGAAPENLAYVIYTSGSTGKPKGVQIMHGAVGNLFSSMRRQPGMTDQDTLLAVTTLSFDIAAVELLLPLTVGARVVVVSREVAADGVRLMEKLAATGATILQATPATWRLLLKAGWQGSRDLKILCGGEALAADLARQLLERCASLWNLYGPTETTIWSTAFRVESADEPIAIGRPVANTQVYLLDAQGQPVPAGIPGELFIGGMGVARGYHNRPELTAERFVPDPFRREPGARLYRTGDLARYLPDGNLEFLGRLDHQVKVRGFRIELGEIETLLRQHPAVRESVVVAREDNSGENRLVAYLVPAPGSTPTASDLRGFLTAKLPDYMVPSAFVLLEALPLTPNGKVDRKALPAPDWTRPALNAAFVPPRTPLEEQLAGLWADVLRLRQVGVHDNFFELGGHSLLATQVVSRLREALHLEIPLRLFFEAPTVAGFARSLEAIRQSALGSAAVPLRAVPREGELPLSFAQETLWFLHQLDPASPAFNMYAAVRLRGDLAVPALEQTLAEIVRRHEALRTTFVSVEGRPVAVIAPAGPVSLPVVDLSVLPEEEREAKAVELAGADAQKPFDLAQGPLVRVTLLRLGAQDHVVLLTMHHIIFDGWSTGVLVQETATLYEAFTRGNPSPLPDLSIQYVDFAHWQRQWLTGERLEAQLAYWKRQLGGELPVLELPTDYPRPAVRSFRGTRQPLKLSAELSEALLALARREGCTLYMTLLAAFQALLHRYSGQEDIAVGSPIANRTRVETEGLIGYFVNTLVLRTDLSGDPSFRELLGRVREVALGAYAHQDLPFEKLVEALRPRRDLSHSSLFQVMFVLQNAPLRIPEVAGLTSSDLVEPDNKTAKFDLTLALTEMPDGLAGSLEYNTDLFAAATIDRMLGHFQTLLQGVVANPGQRLSELPLLTEPERRLVLGEWANRMSAPAPVPGVVERLEAQVERSPDQAAVVFADEQLTYRELNRRANRWAHHLRSLGVGPEVLVGLYVERSVEMVVGLLAILKAGGAYVPLDPANPKGRLADILADARVPLVLTQQRLAADLAETGAEVLCLDTEPEPLGRGSEANPASRAAATHLAYVIYTSGSTGKPKGVMISHGALAHYVDSAGDAYGLDPGDRVLQFASLSFDASVEEIFPCLTRGATLVLRTEAMLDSAGKFLDHCREWALTVVSLPTAYWHELTAALVSEGLALPPGLRLVILGGERALPERLATWQKRVGPWPCLMNTYGPTEATVVATAYPVPTSANGAPLCEVPIGRPLPHVRAYVLDRARQPVPVGVPGELYLGGAGLARGYLNRPELSAEKFLPDPFRPEPGARLYQTGDLVRWLPDGQLEFAGRVDRQVKLRGFRIELGEIEAVLGQHPAVRDAVVLARQDGPGEKRLVAYVVPGRQPAPAAGELRGYLKGRLPEYMLPAAMVYLDALPLTSNGKVDRKALPAPDRVRPGSEPTYVAPRTPVEETLAGIWAQVLGLEKVGVHDNFFELGGHSLQAMQLVAKMSAAVHRDISVRFIFLYPSVAAIAEALEKAPANGKPVGFPKPVMNGFANHAAPGHEVNGPALSRHVRLERQPLLGLVTAGTLGPVRSAALSYLPSSLLGYTGLSPEVVIHDWCGNAPVVTGIQETSLGRIADVLVPRFDFQLYRDQEDLLGALGEALSVAQRLGADTVSLTGLLPSATGYGHALARAIAGRDLPRITTGHATTTAAVVLAVRKALEEAGRDLGGEHVAFLGLGSVGVATLRLMLTCLPRPAEISLCDVYSKREALQGLRRELIEDLGYEGRVHLLESQGAVPDGLYEATLIVGASNVPDILDLDRVRPGTIVVDDSSPHCFRPEQAVQRIRERQDLLCTEGGVLRAPRPIDQVIYLAPALEQVVGSGAAEFLARRDPHHITGCVLSGLLSSCFEDLPPSLGLVDGPTCQRHYDKLGRLGYQAAALHCEDYVLEEPALRDFRQRFGNAAKTNLAACGLAATSG